MSNERRQRILLAVLAGVFVLIIGKQLLPSMFSSTTERRATSADRRASAGNLEGLEVVELRLQDLELLPGEYSPGRDPFRFGTGPRPTAPPPPPPMETTAEDRTRRALEAALAARQQQQDVAAPPRPVPPPVDVVYLGSFGPRSDRLAVFSDGTQIYNAFEGEILNGKFVVVQIGFESADLGFVGFPDAPPQRLAAGE